MVQAFSRQAISLCDEARATRDGCVARNENAAEALSLGGVRVVS
jgi:hypothetical protein